MTARWKNNRKICKRFVIKGDLILLTPAHLGNGEADDVVDMSLTLDVLDEKPYITGTSIAGALRSYLNEVEHGYNQEAEQNSSTNLLFGQQKAKESLESFLIIDDAKASHFAGSELRPGVKIDPASEIAAETALFDMELIRAETIFPLQFELLVKEGLEDRLKQALATALTGFENGEIALGARKRRGFGECKVKKWIVEEYDFTSSLQQVFAWVEGKPGQIKPGDNIAKQLGVSYLIPDKRNRIKLEGKFTIDEHSTLMIGAAGQDWDDPDAVHLLSYRKDEQTGKYRPVPIISGTSFAGALRNRALRIARTMFQDGKDARAFIDNLFGPNILKEKKVKPKASKVILKETVIQSPKQHAQIRNRIDHFTSGTYPGALFSEAPVLHSEDTIIELKLEIRNPSKAEVWLILQVIKDLCLGDLAIGGGDAIGRGYLQGRSLHFIENGKVKKTITQQSDGNLQFDPPELMKALNGYAEAFKEVTG